MRKYNLTAKLAKGLLVILSYLCKFFVVMAMAIFVCMGLNVDRLEESSRSSPCPTRLPR